MKRSKIKIVILLAVAVAINSIPVITYAKDVTNTTNEKLIYVINSDKNWLTEEVAKQLGKSGETLTENDFKNIKKIDLSNTRIDDIFPEEIILLSNLEYLNLNYTKLSGKIPDSLADLKKLTYLDLGDNKLTDIPSELEDKIIEGKYTYCNVEGNKFDLDEGWHFLKGKWCYLDRHGDPLVGEHEIDGQVLQFKEDGAVREGLEEKDGKTYYYEKTGLAKSTWKAINGRWFYFNEDGEMQKSTMLVINNKKYCVDSNGAMVKGLYVYDGKRYYFNENGEMQYGFITLSNNDKYYFAPETGVMIVNSEAVIGGKKYRFDINGKITRNMWMSDSSYIQANGEYANITSTYSHSNVNYRLFKYMTNVSNQLSVDRRAVELHGGRTDNNCVYFASEALRRIGLTIPNSMCNTYQFEKKLKDYGFVSCSDLSYLKPGDIVFTKNYSHVFIFMCWDTDGYAYIVDNQKYNYGNQVLHRRKIYEDTSISDRSTHFYYYPS